MKTPPNQYRRLLVTYLGPQKGKVALLVGLVLLIIALQLVNPQIIRYFIDQLQTGGGLRQLSGAAALFMIMTVARQGILLAATYTGEIVSWTATNWLRADLARHCLRLDLSFHKAHTPGELIERVDGDVNELANFFARMVITIAGNLLLFVGVLVLLWWEGWQIGLAITIIAAVSVIVIEQLRRRITPRWERLRAVEADLFGFLEERLNGTEDIQSSGAREYVMGRLYELLYKRWQMAFYTMKLDAFLIPMPIAVFGLAYAAAHWVGGTLFLQGGMSIGSLYVIFYYIGLIEGPLWQTMEMVDQFQRASASINRIAALTAVQPTLHDGPGVELPATPLGVEFDHVSFHYVDDDPILQIKDIEVEPLLTPSTNGSSSNGTQPHKPSDVRDGEFRIPTETIIDDLTFCLKPGRVLGLLGRTGSGKSTLTKLLFRFYDPTEGTICLIDGRGQRFDLRDCRRVDLQGHIGMVTQEVQLFHASVRENLTLFDDAISDARIQEVLTEVGLSEWLASLPEGLDSQLSGEDSNLSAGEAQLLAFTRVFLADPGLVILDEASSRLDPATEQRIERALDRLLHNRTGIIIAHRLATVQRADEIMILEDGRIREYGSRVVLAADSSSRFSELLQTGLEEVVMKG